MTVEPIALIETRVTVGPSHIAMVLSHHGYTCPLALAVDDLLIDGYKTLVSLSAFVIHEARSILRDNTVIPDTLKVVIPLPLDAIQFVKDYDDEQDVSPTTFVIPLPRHLLRNPVLPMEDHA